MKKKLFLGIFILIFFMGAANASDNATADCDLNQLESEEVDLETETGHTIADLNNDIENAGENDTIELEKDYTLENNTNELTFQKSVTLQGSENRTTIEGNNNDLKLTVYSDNVTIKDLKFSNINNFTLTSHLMLINCSFENIKNLNGTGNIIHLDNCEFINTTLNLPYIENSNFKDSVITLTSRNSNLNNSNISQSYIDLHDENLVIANCNVANHTQISECSYYLNIINSTFTNNSQKFSQYGRKFNIENSSFINNVFSEDFISYDKTQGTIANSRFINNTCGGYLLNFGNESTEINIIGNVFTNNTCNELFYWSYSNFNQYYGKQSQIKLDTSINFSNNIIVNNYNDKKTYSKIHIEPKIGTTSGNDYYASNIIIQNNFLGFNMDDKIEITLIPIFEIVSPKDSWPSLIGWVNVNLNHAGGDEYYLTFENKTDIVTAMPETTFSIKNKDTDEILISNIKINETFNLTTDDVYILNEGLSIINKPKAEIEVEFRCFDFEKIYIKVYLKDGTEVLKSEKIAFRTIAIYSDKNKPSDTYYVKTNSKGYAVAYKTGADYDTIRYLDYTPSAFYFIVSFANEHYGLTKITYKNMKINKTECVVGASSVTTTYKTAKKIKITLKNKKMKTYIQECYIHIYIYKGLEVVHSAYKIINNGKVYYKLPTLKAGTYKIKIKSYDLHYKFTTKAVTLKVKKAQTKTKALKVTGKYRKSKFFKIQVKRSGKPLKYIKVKIKLYTGSHYKIRILKTNKYGIAKYNIRNMKIGKHKVIITSHNKNYHIYKRSSITIKSLHVV